MEVSNVLPAHSHDSNTPADPASFAVNMAGDMDIDMDIDLSIDPEVAALEAEAMRIETQATIQPEGGSRRNDTPDAGSAPPELTQPALEKVHIRGLDHLTTSDMKQFATEHFSSDQFVRVEWIDDTSANIIYETPEAAFLALSRFSDVPSVDLESIPTLQLRNAKKLSTHPTAELQVRQAVVGDVKQRGAHEASRFYLLNPDKDPRERRRQQVPRRGRGDRHSDDRGDYRRRRFDDREHKRRRDEDQGVAFDVSMYDDDTGAAANERSQDTRRGSYSSVSSSGDKYRRRVRFGARNGGDLFADRLAESSNGRLRDRSASPTREGDGRLGFDENESIRRRIRRRSLTPPARRQRNADPPSQSNTGKELFPASAKPSTLPTSADTQQKELFPNKFSPSRRTKELFPHKTTISNHRRTDAFDAANEAADLFAAGMSVPFVDGSGESRPRDLADRITGGQSTFGRLHGRPAAELSRPQEAEGFSVRGTAGSKQLPGFSIRGAAQTNEMNPVVTELFPLKTGGNSGKELFAEKIRGRGGPRRKAEDMFF